MDLVSLACEEIGLGLNLETNAEDEFLLHQSDYNDSYVVNMEKESNGFIPTPGSISFYGDLSNTVFTDSEGKETKLILHEDSR